MNILFQNESVFNRSKKELLALFESDRFKEAINCSSYGICRAVDFSPADYGTQLLFMTVKHHAFTAWERFSGSWAYPIPHPFSDERAQAILANGDCDCLATFAYDDYRSPNAHDALELTGMDIEMTHDEAEKYLKSRWELVEHLKQWFADLTHEQYKAHCGPESQ